MKRVFCLTIVAFTLFSLCSCTIHNKPQKVINSDKFESDRLSFKTNLLKKGSAPQEYENETPPSGVIQIEYQSGDLKLKAWMSKSLKDEGVIHPAVVYVHGGFAFGKSDWDDAKPYINAGYIVLAPTLRGENGNPGSFEFFNGEVDDVIAAGRYLKSQPYVDPEKIFLSGHSTGGTLAMLTSMLKSPYKAVATFGASPDQESFFKQWASLAPFNIDDSKEIEMRSPKNYVESIQKPLFVYVGKEDLAYYRKSRNLVNEAKRIGKECKFISVEGDHFTSLQPSIVDSIKSFKSF